MNNREIKFRAWDKEYSEMIYAGERSGFCEHYLDFVNNILCLLEVQDEDYPRKVDAIIMQYTGLLDMDGKEIYEGDILLNTEHNFKFKIQWGMEGESYAGWAGNWLEKEFISPLYNDPLKNCKIIGNIYENC